jgi:hypothetical protein
VQAFVASLILHTKQSSSGDPTLRPAVTSLLFSLRQEAQRQGLTGRSEEGTSRPFWAVHLSLHQEKPVYTPDEEELASFSRGEENMILEAFARYDQDGSGSIDKEELGMLLQDLGLQVRAGAALCVNVAVMC